MRARPVVVKLGGSLITEWCAAAPALSTERVRVLACELAELEAPLILLHGTGTFGKPPARHYGYLNGRLSAERAAVVATVSAELERLTHALLTALLERKIPAFALPAAGLVKTTADAPELYNAAIVALLSERNLVPLISGGFVADKAGFVAYSSDDIAADLAIALSASALVLATSTCGVENRQDGNAQEFFINIVPEDERVQRALQDDPHDVTGSMKGKVRAAFRAASAGIGTAIIDGRIEGNISAAIAGKAIFGTRVHAKPAPMAANTA